jgi:redox-sensitive bicupin YhaK (pirin superfamily)
MGLHSRATANLDANKGNMMQSSDTFRIVPAATILEGEGFTARRALPNGGLETVGPIIFLNHVGPTMFAPGEALGAPDHPHAGLETLTYLLAGRSVHEDSLGNVSHMSPGEAQWMRAGRGIIHSETPGDSIRKDGGLLHGVQLWINMPAEHKFDAPDYRHIAANQIPRRRIDGGVLKLIAGDLFGLVGPVRTFAQPLIAHIAFAGPGSVDLPVQGIPQVAVYVLRGSVAIGKEERTVREGSLAIIADGRGPLSIKAKTTGDVIVFGGVPLDEPIVRHGPFVLNSHEQIAKAISDYGAGVFGREVQAQV